MLVIDKKNLKNQIAEGGEGFLYEYKQNTIIKIYKDTVDKNEKEKKIKLLINKKLSNNIIMPLEAVYDTNNKFIGYIMNKVTGETLKMLTNKKYVQINNITIKDILFILINIKNSLFELHKNNIVVGDLNEKNLLFDKNMNVYFIDMDSCSIENFKGTVCMETFKDPLLIQNNFTFETDMYSFAILVFKILTRLHPFGGTTVPDMNIIERMEKKISVIDNKDVTIPSIIDNWAFISPNLLKELKKVYENNKRFLVSNTLEDFYQNLQFCKNHNNYYYSKYLECPVCNNNAKILEKPIKVETKSGIPIHLLYSNLDIKTIINFNSFIDKNNYIINRFNGLKKELANGNLYYFSNNNIVYTVSDNKINIETENNNFVFEKINKTTTIVNDNIIYFIDKTMNLVKLTITDKGNFSEIISQVAFNNIYEIYDNKNYFICNSYNNIKIININGYHYELKDNEKIVNYGIHFDLITKRWLFIIENEKGDFKTFIFENNNILYENHQIKYTNNLSNLCFNNNVIYGAGNKFIKGFNYEKNIYKNFECDIINDDSKLLKNERKFTVINTKEIYEIG